MGVRFSKSVALGEILRRANHQKAEFERAARKPLDPGNGWAQCRGLPVEAAVAYGAWRALLDLARDIAAGEVA